MKVVLKLQNSSGAIEIELNANHSVTIGRSSRCTYKVSDEMMSGSHCKITLIPPRLEVIDLDSKNGTFINSIRVDQSQVFMGDEIRIGSTKLGLIADKMHPETIKILTFPGGANDRGVYALQLDFTGARKINQTLQNPSSKRPAVQSIEKEVETRIRAHSRIKLSKYEIKLKNKKSASFASVCDAGLILLAMALPLFIINFLILMQIQGIQENRETLLLVIEVLCVGSIYLLNYKAMKFTFGEKMSGIESKYMNQ